MSSIFQALLPELILIATACVLLLMGAAKGAGVRKVVPIVALLALAFVFIYQLTQDPLTTGVLSDPANSLRVFTLAQYIKLLAAGVGILLVLLAWPSNRDATGNAAIDFSTEAGEFFGLMLLSISGIFLVASANDLILLFLGIELASIPTYIMVSISRPIPAAQEAGVKYFFLGAMAAALMLFGFSYLYGTTGTITLDAIGAKIRGTTAMTSATTLDAWQTLGVVMLLAGFAFKLAAVPLHFYAGDVYQGAATPVTAFLSFVPKTSAMVALVKILYAAGGNSWATPDLLVKLLWAIAALTMTVGNVLGLWQLNIKRLFACSSIAHSGYMLVGVTALIGASSSVPAAAKDFAQWDVIHGVQLEALQGVLFYLAAYGIMNAGAFGVLMLLPARPVRSWSGRTTPVPPATTAETFEDLAGQGRRHPALGLAMAVCCFSLIGLPLTVGFFGKLYLIRPALHSKLYWLVVITMINAAISAAYYLRIVATMFLRGGSGDDAIADEPLATPFMPWSIRSAVFLSVFGTLVFGTIVPATQLLVNRTTEAAQVEPGRQRVPAPVTASR
jgi:NADH-quinone oxidoreductase subunit N